MYACQSWLGSRKPRCSDSPQSFHVLGFALERDHPLPGTPFRDVRDFAVAVVGQCKALQSADEPGLLRRPLRLLHEARIVNVCYDGPSQGKIVSPLLWRSAQHRIDLANASLAKGDALILAHVLQLCQGSGRLYVG